MRATSYLDRERPRRPRYVRWFASAVVVAALFVGAPAAAQAAPVTPSVTMTLTSTWGGALGQSGVWDAANATFGVPELTTTGIEVGADPKGFNSFEFRFGFHPPKGQTLHRGTYTDVARDQDGSDGSLPVAAMHIYEDAGLQTIIRRNDVQILDLAADSAGNIIRLDLVFRNGNVTPANAMFGEIRVGEPQAATVELSTRTISWPQSPVGAPLVHSTVQVRNTSRVRETPTAVIATSKADFAVTDDTCTGRSLRPSTTCLVTVGYSPATPGAHSGELDIMVGGSTQRVALAGSAPSGYSEFKTSGRDYIDSGQVHDYPDGPYQLVADGDATHVISFWPMKVYDDQFGGIGAQFSPPAGQALVAGKTYLVKPFTVGTAGMSVYGEGRGCDSYQGSFTIRQLVFSYGAISSADIRFTQACSEQPDDLMTGEIQWRLLDRPLTLATVFPHANPATSHFHDTITIAGTARASSDVRVYFHTRGVPGYTLRRALVADSLGRFHTTYVATDDNTYYVTNGAHTTTPITTNVAPTVTGPATAKVALHRAYTLSGTGAPGTRLTIHFHRGGTAPNDYSILRQATVQSSGKWTYSTVVSGDFGFYVTSDANHTQSPNYVRRIH